MSVTLDIGTVTVPVGLSELAPALFVGTSPALHEVTWRMYTEHTETAAVSCGTSHASACRIACEHSESA